MQIQIYELSVDQITLREMIMLQGLFSSSSQSFIGEIIEEQNNT